MIRPRLIMFAVAVVLFGWLFFDALFGGGMFAFRDGAHFYYPLLKLVTEEWAAGRVPLWNPYENLGQPLAGNPTSSVFYPGMLVFALPLGYAWCYRLYVLGHLVLAAVGMYCLARRFGASVPASGMAAISYAFSGNVLYQYCNVVFLVGAAWLPVAVLAADRMLRQRKPGAVALGVVLALMVLGGDPQMAYHAGLIAAGYAAWLWWTERPLSLRERVRVRGARETASTQDSPHPGPLPEGEGGIMCHRFTLLALAAVSALLLSAIQVLPSMEYAAESGRDPDSFADRALCRIEPGTHAEHTYHFSVGPWRLAEYVWPNVLGRQFPVHRRWIGILPAEGRVWVPSLYMGLFPVLLALSAMRVRKRGRGSVSAAQEKSPAPFFFFRWVVGLAVLASLGWYGLGWLASEVAVLFGGDPNGAALAPGPVGGLYWLMTVVLPGYGYFRYPAKLLVVAALGLSMLAAAGFDQAFGEPSPRFRRGLLWLGGFSMLGAVAALGVRPWWGGWMAGAQPDVLFGPLDAAGAANDLAWAFGQTAVLCGVLWWLLGRSGCGVECVVGRISNPSKEPGRIGNPSYSGRATLLGWPAMAAVVVVAIDLAVANRWMIVTAPASLWQEKPTLAAAIDRHAGRVQGEAPIRVYRHPLWLPGAWRKTGSRQRLAEAVRWDRDTLWPKYPLIPRLAVAEVHGTMLLGDYQDVLRVGRSNGDVFRLGEYVVLPEGKSLPGGQRIDVPTGDVSLWHNPEGLPRSWIEHARVDDALAGVPASIAGESCNIERYEPTRVEVSAELAEPGMVVLADQFYPGWQLEVQTEGRGVLPRGIERTRQVMRGVWLEAGRHRLVYRYRPGGVVVGAVLSGFAWLVVAGWGVVMWRRQRG